MRTWQIAVLQVVVIIQVWVLLTETDLFSATWWILAGAILVIEILLVLLVIQHIRTPARNNPRRTSKDESEGRP